MTITRAQALLLLEPKISNIWFDAYPEWPVEWTRFLNTRTANKAKVTDFRMTGFGGLAYKSEGAVPSYDEPIFGGTKEYTPVKRALAYAITDEMIRHELYGTVERFEREIMKSAIDGQEVSAALILNNGFSTTVPANAEEYSATGFDGLALFSTAHTRLDGGATQRNRPSTDADLSVSSLQSALVDIESWKNDRGRPLMVRPRTLVVHPSDMFTAKELLQSEYKPGTANNEINALKDMGMAFMVSHYLTDSDAFFVICDQHDLNFIWDQRPYTKTIEAADLSEVIDHMVAQSYATGFGSWLGAWGTTGAA